LDHQVAIKTLNSTTNLAAESFLREAQALALLDHPNVVRVFDADISSGVPFIVMELITGSD
jgi:eukaryotic-like serine/threonine-protein kinase